MSRYAVSFQMYSSRLFPAAGQLAYLAEVGFDAVELFLPNYQADAAGFRREADAAGLKISGIHMPLAGLDKEPKRFFDYAHTLGATTLIPPYVGQAERRPTVEYWRSVGEILARGAEAAKAEGLRVEWHNHDYEYVKLEDRSRPIDHIMDAAGPAVTLELDIGWVMRGWADPAQELVKYAGRITTIQLKDTAPAGTALDDGWVPTGDGIIDWTALYPLFGATKATTLVVEHDNPSDWKLLAKRSVDYIRALVG